MLKSIFWFSQFRLNIIIIFIVLATPVISCKTIEDREILQLVHRSDDFIIYRDKFHETKNKLESQNLFIKSFLVNLCYPKSNNFFSDKQFIFTDESAEKISEILSDKLYVETSLYVIFKKEDPISPYSRIYRTIFSLKVHEDKVVINFVEIDKNIIFGNQYTYSDWVSFQDKAECNYKKNLSLFKYLDNVMYSQSDICIKEVFNKFSLYRNKLTKSPGPTKENLEEKLNELNELLKNGLINQSEYIKMRSKIINNFGDVKE